MDIAESSNRKSNAECPVNILLSLTVQYEGHLLLKSWKAIFKIVFMSGVDLLDWDPCECDSPFCPFVF